MAQKNELAFLAGANFTPSRDFSIPLPVVPCVIGSNCSGSGAVSFGHNVTYQATYARRIFNAQILSLSVETPFLAATSISVKTNNPVVLPPNNYSAFYFTSGLRLTAFSLAGISPRFSFSEPIGIPCI